MNVLGDDILSDSAFAGEQHLRVALGGVFSLLEEIDRDFINRDRLDITSI
jgi:hypothetical protein